jgi:hypothetical protein
MRRPPVGDHVAVAGHLVVEAEASAAELADAGVDAKAVVEMRRLEVADVGLEDEGLQPGLAQRGVTSGVLLEVGDTRDLEPDEVDGVMDDALRIGLGKAGTDVRAEPESGHRRHSTAVDCDGAAREPGGRGLGRGALDRLLVEQPLAAGADLPLDVIRDPGALPDGVNRHRVVLVSTHEGHSVSSG